MSIRVWIDGMEGVWLIFLLGSIGLAVGLTAALRRWRLPVWRTLLRGEAGVSYTLSFVLVIPFYLTIMLVVFEMAFLLVAKVGTMYATHAAVRARVVWDTAFPIDLREPRTHQAATLAMTAFVSSAAPDSGKAPAHAQEAATEFATAARRYMEPTLQASPPVSLYERWRQPPDEEMLRQRYLAAAARTTVEVETDPARPDGPVKVTLTFRAPLYMPLVSRFFDPDGGAPFEYPITTTVTLPNEAPTTPDRTLGIPYHSWPRP